MTAGDPAEARYRIGAVAHETGIPVETLRIWERRYRVVTPERSPRGGRLYTDVHVARLRRIKQLVERGHAIGQVAGLDEAQIQALLERASGTGAPDLAELRTRFISAVDRMDARGAQQLLGRAALLLGTRALILDLVVPLLHEIGERWVAGSVRVCHEHVASAIIRTVLGSLLATQPPGPRARTIVVATPGGELHELGALLVALLAAVAGWDVLYLGPNLPAEEILAATQTSGAAAVALSIVHVADRAEAAAVKAWWAAPAETPPRGCRGRSASTTSRAWTSGCARGPMRERKLAGAVLAASMTIGAVGAAVTPAAASPLGQASERTYRAGQLAGDSPEARQRFADGIALARKALERDPHDPSALLWLAANLGGEALTHGKLYALRVIGEIERTLLQLEHDDPSYDHAAAARVLGRLYHKAPALISVGSSRKAAAYLEEALARAPEFPGNWAFAADFYLDRHDCGRAKPLADRLRAAGDLDRFGVDGREWRAIAAHVADDCR